MEIAAAFVSCVRTRSHRPSCFNKSVVSIKLFLIVLINDVKQTDALTHKRNSVLKIVYFNAVIFSGLHCISSG